MSKIFIPKLVVSEQLLSLKSKSGYEAPKSAGKSVHLK
jgi:hypothetical protein